MVKDQSLDSNFTVTVAPYVGARPKRQSVVCFYEESVLAGSVTFDTVPGACILLQTHTLSVSAKQSYSIVSHNSTYLSLLLCL